MQQYSRYGWIRGQRNIYIVFLWHEGPASEDQMEEDLILYEEDEQHQNEWTELC